MPSDADRQAVVFDLDNTLVHSQIDFRAIRVELGDLLLAAGAVDEPILTEGPGRRSIGQLIDLCAEHDTQHGTGLSTQMWAIVERYEREGMRLASVEPDAAPTMAELRRRGFGLAV